MTNSEEQKLRERLIEYILCYSMIQTKEKLEQCSTIELLTIKVDIEIKLFRNNEKKDND